MSWYDRRCPWPSCHPAGASGLLPWCSFATLRVGLLGSAEAVLQWREAKLPGMDIVRGVNSIDVDGGSKIFTGGFKSGVNGFRHGFTVTHEAGALCVELYSESHDITHQSLKERNWRPQCNMSPQERDRKISDRRGLVKGQGIRIHGRKELDARSSTWWK